MSGTASWAPRPSCWPASNAGTGAPDAAYLGAVRNALGSGSSTPQTPISTRPGDYQHEIALRHAPAKKNKTDGVQSTPLVPMRYLSALTVPVTTTLKPFLAKKGASAADVEKMHAAWVKSVLLQTILWSQPYVRDGQF